MYDDIDMDDYDDIDVDVDGIGVGYREVEIREQDRYLPIANIARIMKKVLPSNAKIAKEAKESIQECVSEFISFITSEASDKCQQEKRKTINGDDILWAMGTLGFDKYGDPLRMYLAKYRDSVRGDKPEKKSSSKKDLNAQKSLYNNNNNNQVNTNSSMDPSGAGMTYPRVLGYDTSHGNNQSMSMLAPVKSESYLIPSMLLGSSQMMMSPRLQLGGLGMIQNGMPPTSAIGYPNMLLSSSSTSTSSSPAPTVTYSSAPMMMTSGGLIPTASSTATATALPASTSASTSAYATATQTVYVKSEDKTTATNATGTSSVGELSGSAGTSGTGPALIKAEYKESEYRPMATTTT